MSTPNHSQYAFVFICKGPDPGGMRPANMVMTDRGVYEGLVQSFGFGGSAENVFFYGPDWNSTVYSSSVITGSEGDDLMGKVKAAMSAKGFTYNGEPVRSVPYDPSTTYGQMGFIMVFLFAEKTAEPDAVSFAMSAAAPVAVSTTEPVA